MILIVIARGSHKITKSVIIFWIRIQGRIDHRGVLQTPIKQAGNFLQAGLPSLEECLMKTEALKSKSDNTIETVKMYLLSNTPEVGLQIGLKYVKGNSCTKITVLKQEAYLQ